MKRHFVNLLTALSLLLFVAVCVLWAASGTHFRSVGYNKSPDTVYSAGVMRGRALLSIVHRPWGTGAPSSVEWTSLPLSMGSMPGWESFGPPKWRGRFGFRYSSDASPGYQYQGLVIPLWVPAVFLAFQPGLWTFRRVRHRHLRNKRPPNTCRSCGYDLRASPSRCPECGAAAGTPA